MKFSESNFPSQIFGVKFSEGNLLTKKLSDLPKNYVTVVIVTVVIVTVVMVTVVTVVEVTVVLVLKVTIAIVTVV